MYIMKEFIQRRSWHKVLGFFRREVVSMCKYSALEIAKWFLGENRRRMAEEDSDYISNLKLQKLLYYAQGCYLAIKGNALFREDILAWEHGPVVRDIYDRYRRFGADGINEPDKNYYVPIDSEDEKILLEVFDAFGIYSAWKLRNMTHEETPWQETEPNGVIKTSSIKEYFENHYIEN